MIGRMYQALKPSRSESIPIRRLDCHVRTWGQREAGHAPLVLLHGWMDVSASWQFMVDALRGERWIVAPDWRGFGLTRQAQGPSPDCYWLPDYLADLDMLLDRLVGAQQPVDLVGHSMGGHVAMTYAGVRPERIRRLVNLEGFGLPETRPAQAPGRYAQWLDEIKAFHQGEQALKAYGSADGVAQRLMKTNPRLTRDKADWLARQWAAPDAQGAWRILGDAAHRTVNPYLFRLDETLAIYRRIRAPLLSVTAGDDSLSRWRNGQYTLAQYHERLGVIADVRHAVVADAGHMLHHDQPAAVARLIEEFTIAAA